MSKPSEAAMRAVKEIIELGEVQVSHASKDAVMALKEVIPIMVAGYIDKEFAPAIEALRNVHGYNDDCYCDDEIFRIIAKALKQLGIPLEEE